MGTYSLYVTLSGPSHTHTCQRMQGPICVDLWHGGPVVRGPVVNVILCSFLGFACFFKIMFVFNQCIVILLGTCLTYCFRVTVSAAVSSLVGPAHGLICCYLCWCDIFEQNKFHLIWFDNWWCWYLQSTAAAVWPITRCIDDWWVARLSRIST